MSASGVSSDINQWYKAIYDADEPVTGEPHTYLSRDEAGGVLYPTHHFAYDELKDLVTSAELEARSSSKIFNSSTMRDSNPY